MTEPTLTAVEEIAPEAERQRERSTIAFPYSDLNDGIRVAKTVHDLGDRCSHDQLITPLGYSTIENGSYKQSIAGARHFGLISYSKEGVTLTPLGHSIVDPTQETRARATAFQTVPLYARLYEEYKGHSLPPSTVGLESVLMGYGVAAKQKTKARQVLSRSAYQAGYFYQGQDRLVLPAVANQPAENASPASDQSGVSRGGGSPSDGDGGGRKLPTLIQGLIERLPEEGELWHEADQKQWIETAKMIFGLVYETERPALPSPRADNGLSGGLAE